MSNTVYCLPIIKSTQAEVLATIQQHRQHYGAVEVWVDYITDLDTHFITRLIDELGAGLCVVFRRQNLEAITMPLAQRLELLETLDQTAAYADLDIANQQPELQHIASKKLQLNTIVSHHDYTQTPDDGALQKLITDMQRYQPTILKIACLCQHEQDALRLLQCQLDLRKQGQRCIMLGMGKAGLVTRIFGTLWGNALAFAPETLTEASAPGQLTRNQMQTILNILEGQS